MVAYDLALTNVLADIIGDQSLVDQLPNVNFALLDLAVTPRTGAFALRAEGEIDWKPPFGVPGLAIRDLAVNAARPAADAEGRRPVAASLSGKLVISAQQQYDLTVKADLITGGGGLRFAGATGPGQEIRIGKLVDDLSVKFGGVTLPAALAELVVLNLRVAIDTTKKSFSFAAETKFPIEGGRTVDATVTIDLTQVAGTYTGTFGGQVTVGALGFDLHFARSATVTFCVATYRHLAAEGNATPGINVRELVGHLSTDVAEVVPADLQIDLKDVILVLGRTDAGTRCLVGLDVGARLGLSSLPLVGQQFSTDQTASIDDLRLLVATGDLRRSDVTTINGLLPTGIAPLVLPAATTDAAAAAADVVITSGPTVSATLSLGGTSQSLALPVASPPARTGVAAGAPAPSDPTKWFTVQRTFGPVHLARVGVQYRDSVLWFLLDAALSALGLTLSLDGLGAGSPITRFEPRFTLRGLGVDYKNPAIEIGAAFLHVTVTDAQGRTYDEYDGAAIVKAQGLTLSAIGSYAYLDGHPSLFVYAVLDYPIGGPAFFFVTGLAAGFGYNRGLVVPSDRPGRAVPVGQRGGEGRGPATGRRPAAAEPRRAGVHRAGPPARLPPAVRRRQLPRRGDPVQLVQDARLVRPADGLVRPSRRDQCPRPVHPGRADADPRPGGRAAAGRDPDGGEGELRPRRGVPGGRRAAHPRLLRLVPRLPSHRRLRLLRLVPHARRRRREHGRLRPHPRRLPPGLPPARAITRAFRGWASTGRSPSSSPSRVRRTSPSPRPR